MKKKHRNLRKAAVLFASLDAENARAVLGQMSREQVQALREAVNGLGDIDSTEQGEVIEEFFRIGPLVPGKQPAGLDLDGRLPKHLSMSSAARDPSGLSDYGAPVDGGQPFRFLCDASSHSLAVFLEREHPQTIAVVVSHLPSERAAETLASLPSDLQVEVARRLVDLDETDPEILREVERGVECWLGEQLRSHRRRDAGMTTLNNILDAASPQAKQHILSNLGQRDRPLAGTFGTLAQPAFSFAELELLDSASLTVVLHHADIELLVLALAGASPALCERVFELFPSDDAAQLRESLVHLGPTRLSDVEESQQALAELAAQLRVRGEIAASNRTSLSVAV